jgi:hypothetical protein
VVWVFEVISDSLMCTENICKYDALHVNEIKYLFVSRNNDFISVVSIPLCYIKFRSYTLSNTTR